MREGICMEKITVWTKQHKAVLETLEQEGRYVAKRQFVEYETLSTMLPVSSGIKIFSKKVHC